MRTSTFFLLLFCTLACTSMKNTLLEPSKLNGTWIPVQQEMGGIQLPATAFEKQQLILLDGTYSFTAESIDKGEVKFTGSKMDIYGKEGVNSGKHFTALWKYENGQLFICYNLQGDSYPANFETKSNRMYFLSVFKKDLKK